MPTGKKGRKFRSQHSLTNYLLSVGKSQARMSQNGAGSSAASSYSTPEHSSTPRSSEYNTPLSKADLNAILSAIYEKLVNKIQLELADSFAFMQAQVEDLNNRNCHNNIRVHGISESATDHTPFISKFFHNLLPDIPLSAFTYDRIHRALRPKPTPDKPPCEIIMCMKKFLTKEDIMRASRNTSNIALDGNRVQIYPDISMAPLDRRRRMGGYHHTTNSKN